MLLMPKERKKQKHKQKQNTINENGKWKYICIF